MHSKLYLFTQDCIYLRRLKMYLSNFAKSDLIYYYQTLYVSDDEVLIRFNLNWNEEKMSRIMT